MGLRSFFEPIIPEMKLESRITVDEWMENLKRGYDLRYAAVYLDDLDAPNHCLVLALYPGMISRGLFVAITLMYSKPGHRGDKAALKAMRDTYNSYAKIHGAEAIQAASWSFRGARKIDKIWSSDGFEEESITHIKIL